MAPQFDVKPYADVVVREISLVTSTLREKGSKRFGRTFVLSGFMVFAAFFGIYTPPQKKSARLDAEIKRAKMMSDYSKQYKDLRDRLEVAYSNLSDPPGRSQWLSNSVRDSLNSGGLIPDDFRPVREEEISGLVFQTASVALNVRFPEFFDWLQRLENSRPMMRLTSLELTKRNSSGYNSANCDVSTVIPIKRYR